MTDKTTANKGKDAMDVLTPDRPFYVTPLFKYDPGIVQYCARTTPAVAAAVAATMNQENDGDTEGETNAIRQTPIRIVDRIIEPIVLGNGLIAVNCDSSENSLIEGEIEVRLEEEITFVRRPASRNNLGERGGEHGGSFTTGTGQRMKWTMRGPVFDEDPDSSFASSGSTSMEVSATNIIKGSIRRRVTVRSCSSPDYSGSSSSVSRYASPNPSVIHQMYTLPPFKPAMSWTTAMAPNDGSYGGGNGLPHGTVSSSLLQSCTSSKSSHLICWAYFASKKWFLNHFCHHRKSKFCSNIRPNPNWSDKSRIRKKYLCVLASPTQLRIFDVFCDHEQNAHLLREDPEAAAFSSILESGTTINLPIEAVSIRPNPFGGGTGILLERAVRHPDDHEAWTRHLQTEQILRQQQSPEAKGGKTENSSDDIGSNRAPQMPSMLNPSVAATQGDASMVSERNFSLAPPNLGTFMPPQPRRLLTIDTAAAQMEDDDMDEGIGLQTPHISMPGESSYMPQATGEDMFYQHEEEEEEDEIMPVPSWFSLLHPMDEVRPISIQQKHSKSHVEDAQDLEHPTESPCHDTGLSSLSRKNHSNIHRPGCDEIQYLEPMSDVYETMLFVGNCCAKAEQKTNGNILENNATLTICVTYHTQLGRHAVWSIQEAHPPPPGKALWERERERRRLLFAAAAAADDGQSGRMDKEFIIETYGYDAYGEGILDIDDEAEVKTAALTETDNSSKSSNNSGSDLDIEDSDFNVKTGKKHDLDGNTGDDNEGDSEESNENCGSVSCDDALYHDNTDSPYHPTSGMTFDLYPLMSATMLWEEEAPTLVQSTTPKNDKMKLNPMAERIFFASSMLNQKTCNGSNSGEDLLCILQSAEPEPYNFLYLWSLNTILNNELPILNNQFSDDGPSHIIHRIPCQTALPIQSSMNRKNTTTNKSDILVLTVDYKLHVYHAGLPLMEIQLDQSIAMNMPLHCYAPNNRKHSDSTTIRFIDISAPVRGSFDLSVIKPCLSETNGSKSSSESSVVRVSVDMTNTCYLSDITQTCLEAIQWPGYLTPNERRGESARAETTTLISTLSLQLHCDCLRLMQSISDILNEWKEEKRLSDTINDAPTAICRMMGNEDLSWLAFECLIKYLFDEILLGNCIPNFRKNDNEHEKRKLTAKKVDECDEIDPITFARTYSTDPGIDDKDDSECLHVAHNNDYYVDDGDQDDSDDDWNFLLHSECHKSYEKIRQQRLQNQVYDRNLLESADLDGLGLILTPREYRETDDSMEEDSLNSRQPDDNFTDKNKKDPASNFYYRFIIERASAIGLEFSVLKSSRNHSSKINLLLFAQHVFDHLHMVYEDSKISPLRGLSWMTRLGALLMDLSNTHLQAAIVGKTDVENTIYQTHEYIDYYQRDTGGMLLDCNKGRRLLAPRIESHPHEGGIGREQHFISMSSFKNPLNVLEWLETIFLGDYEGDAGDDDNTDSLSLDLSNIRSVARNDGPPTTLESINLLCSSLSRNAIPPVCTSLHRTSRIMNVVVNEEVNESSREITRTRTHSQNRHLGAEAKIVLELVQHQNIKSTEKLQEVFCPAMTLFLLDVIRNCRENPPLPHLTYCHDSILSKTCTRSYKYWPLEAYELIDRQDLAALRAENIRIGMKNNKSSSPAASSESNLSSPMSRYLATIPSSGTPLDDGADATAATARGGGITSLSNVHAGVGGSSGSNPPDENNDDIDGLITVQRASSMYFCQDQRVKEACRLLCTSKAMYMVVPRPTESTDHEYEHLKQLHLAKLVRRCLSLPLGRGMLTMGTYPMKLTSDDEGTGATAAAVASNIAAALLADPVPVPPIILAAKTPPKDATVTFDTSLLPNSTTAELSVWPEFHNGVAAGLRLTPLYFRKSSTRTRAPGFSSSAPNLGGARGGGSNSGGEGLSQMIRTWILYNKTAAEKASSAALSATGSGNPPTASAAASSMGRSAANKGALHAHGGLLLALGLRGYLTCLEKRDWTEYLQQNGISAAAGSNSASATSRPANMTISVGLFLGMGANLRGTCDPLVAKMLCVHIPSFLPPSLSALDVTPGSALVAAISGIGLLYEGSCHRMMTEHLLTELSRRPTVSHDTSSSNGSTTTGPSDSSHDNRESYNVACGIALGMINLGKGAKGQTYWRKHHRIHTMTSSKSKIRRRSRLRSSRGGPSHIHHSEPDYSRNELDGLADLKLEERLWRFVVGTGSSQSMHHLFNDPLAFTQSAERRIAAAGGGVHGDDPSYYAAYYYRRGGPGGAGGAGNADGTRSREGGGAGAGGAGGAGTGAGGSGGMGFGAVGDDGTGYYGNLVEPSSRIDEGPPGSVNTHVTAAGSILALTLMYAQTRNRAMADQLSLPDTQTGLDGIRPDLLLLRVIGRTLIVWDEKECVEDGEESSYSEDSDSMSNEGESNGGIHHQTYSIEPSKEWILGQRPVIVQRAFEKLRTIAENAVHKASGGTSASFVPGVSGGTASATGGLASLAELALGSSSDDEDGEVGDASNIDQEDEDISQAETERMSSSPRRRTYQSKKRSSHTTKRMDDEDEARPSSSFLQNETDEDSDVMRMLLDCEALRRMHIYVVTGACMALGLRFAGTGRKDVALSIRSILEELFEWRQSTNVGGTSVARALRPTLSILEQCCANIALALAMVMSGTGDLKTFQLLRQLRWTVHHSMVPPVSTCMMTGEDILNEDGSSSTTTGAGSSSALGTDVRYGTHMCYGAAIGLLFLGGGGGSVTLGNSLKDIAVLLMSFFPTWPATIADQQFHLQALRHMYVLACHSRTLEVIDVDTRKPMFVPVELKAKDGSVVSTHLAPFILPSHENQPLEKRWTLASVASHRYFPVSLRSNVGSDENGNFARSMVLYVKKRSGRLTYVQDPHEFRSLLVQVGGGGGGGQHVSFITLVKSFTDDRTLLMFAEYFCRLSSRPLHNLDATRRSKVPLLQCSEEQCANLLLECLTQEKLEVLFVLYGFLDLLLRLKSQCAHARSASDPMDNPRPFVRSQNAKQDLRPLTVLDVWNVRLLKAQIRKFQQSKSSESHSNQTFIVSETFATFICEAMDQYFALQGKEGTSILTYIEQCHEELSHHLSLSRSGTVETDDKIFSPKYDRLYDHSKLFGSFLTWHRVPFPLKK